MSEPDEQDEVLAKRLIEGQEAKRLLQNPLIESFFAGHYADCYKAFCDLPMGSSLEEYKTVHHNYLALQQLRGSLQEYITRAETDIVETKRLEEVPEDIEI